MTEYLFARIDDVEDLDDDLQAQIDTINTTLAGLADIVSLTPTDGGFIVGDGSVFVVESGATARASLSVYSIAQVDAFVAALQPLDGGLTDIAGLAVTDGNIIVGNGTNWVAESGATARTSLGLGTADTPEFASLKIGSAGAMASSLLVIDGDGASINQILFRDTGLSGMYLKQTTAGHVEMAVVDASSNVLIQATASLRLAGGGGNTELTVSATELIWNESGGDFDVRFEGDGQTHLFFLDASVDFVGFGTSAPAARVHAAHAGSLQFRGVSTAASGTTSGGFISVYQNDGTTMAATERMGGIIMGGAEDGSGTLGNGVALVAFATETWSNSTHGSVFAIEVCPAGSTTRNELMRFGGTSIIFNENGGDYDIRMEGDNNANVFYLDAGNDRIGIGTNTPGVQFHIYHATQANMTFESPTQAQYAIVSPAMFIYFQDSTSGADAKTFRIASGFGAGFTTFQALSDNFAVQESMLTFQHASYRVDIGNDASSVTLCEDAAWAFSRNGNTRILAWASNDYEYYDQSQNFWQWVIGGKAVMRLDGTSLLDVIADDTGQYPNISATGYGTSTGGGTFHTRFARGTHGSPSQVLASDQMGGMGGRGYMNSGAFHSSSPAAFHFYSAENQTATANGAYFQFFTTAIGTTFSNRKTRGYLTHDGTWMFTDTGTHSPITSRQTKPHADVLCSVVAEDASGSTGVSFGAIMYGGSNVRSPGLRGFSARGTAASPTATQADDFLVYMGGHGYNTTDNAFSTSNNGMVAVKALEAFTNTAQGTYIIFETTPAGSTTRAERMRLTNLALTSLVNVVAPNVQQTVRISGVNFNSANTDNAISITLPTGFSRWRMGGLTISGASASLTTSNWGLFTSTGGGGTAIFSAGQANTVSTASENTTNNMQLVTHAGVNTTSYNATTIYFRVGTAQGSAATGNVTVFFQPVS